MKTSGVRPLFVALALLMLGNGLQSSLVGLAANTRGFGTSTTGVVMSGYYVGFLIGAMTVPRIVSAVGHIRVYAGLASLGSMALLIYTLFVDPSLWFVMRLMTGFCLAGLYMVAESWLNAAVPNEARGRMLSIYMVVVTGGLAGGQLLLNVGEPDGFQLFVIASVLVSFAVVPIALAPSEAPPIPAPERGLPIRETYQRVPLGVVGAVLVGTTGGAFYAIAPVWADDAGMSIARISFFMFAALIGGVALQWPLGSLSDRISRRRVLLGASLGAAAAAVWLVLAPALGLTAIVAVFLYGGMSMPMYSLAISHVNDATPEDRMVAVGAVLMFSNGLGAIAGPFLGSAAIALFGSMGFWLFLAVLHGGFAIFSSYRVIRLRAMDVTKQAFLSVPTRSTSVVWTYHGDDAEDADEQG